MQGTTTTANVVKLLPEIARAGLIVKIVAVISPQLFALQDAAYRESVASLADQRVEQQKARVRVPARLRY